MDRSYHTLPSRSAIAAKITENVLRLGCTALVIAFAIVTYKSVTSRADEHHEFLRLQIIPGSASLQPEAQQNFTVIGVYHSPEAQPGDNVFEPMEAQWQIAEGEGSLTGCESASRCTFTAGDAAGISRLEAATDLGSETVSIDVIAPPVEVRRRFEDDVPAWATPYVEELTARDIMRGYEPLPGEELPRFGASDPVTRGQIVTLIRRVLLETGLIADNGLCAAGYTDVPQTHFAHDAIALFRQQGWSSSTQDTFEPDAPASRAVTATFMDHSLGDTVLAALGATRPEVLAQNSFDDIPADSPFHGPAEVVRFAGIMSGQGGVATGSSYFDTDGTLNRAQAAAVIYRTLQVLEGHGIQDLMGYDPDAQCASSAGGEGEELTEGVDLTIPAIELSPATPTVGERITFRFTVQNLGNEDAGPTWTQLYIDKGNDGTWNIGVEPETPAVPAGESIIVEYPFTPNPDPAQAHHIPAGTHRLQLCADYDMHFLGEEPIEESNEENNCREMTFTVSGAVPQPNGALCTSNSACSSGNCIDGFCCNTSCSGTCQACNISGAAGTCTAIANGQDPANECPGDAACNGTGACRPF